MASTKKAIYVFLAKSNVLLASAMMIFYAPHANLVIIFSKDNAWRLAPMDSMAITLIKLVIIAIINVPLAKGLYKVTANLVNWDCSYQDFFVIQLA
jgi:hypothetical protein